MIHIVKEKREEKVPCCSTLKFGLIQSVINDKILWRTM